jgi:hypothetical protein
MGDPFLDAARAGEGGAGQRGEVPAATVVPAPEALAFQLVAAPLDDVAAAAEQTAPALVERGGLVGDHFRQAAAVARRIRDLELQTAALLRQSDATISAFNVGANCGAAAGQTIFHCHVHLIPRREGDTANPRGGVRGVIPDKRSY